MDLKKKKVLMSNGCSHVFGSEIIIEKGPLVFQSEENKRLSFSGLLASHYDLECHNIALPGGCNDRIYRTTMMWCVKYLNSGKKLSDLVVIIGWTATFRIEFMYDEEYWIVVPRLQFLEDRPKWFRSLYKYLMTYTMNYKFERDMRLTQIIGLASFLNEIGVDYVMLNGCHPVEQDYPEESDEFKNYYPTKNFFEPYDSFLTRYEGIKEYEKYKREGGHWGREIHALYAKELDTYIKGIK